MDFRVSEKARARSLPGFCGFIIVLSGDVVRICKGVWGVKWCQASRRAQYNDLMEEYSSKTYVVGRQGS